MPSRGRHQTTSKECSRMLRRVEQLAGVSGVMIGRSYGGKSLGQGHATGALRIQRTLEGGIKAVMQSAKGLQEVFIRTEAGQEDAVASELRRLEIGH